ncbi:MAG: hypothetical protein P8011_12230 [Acidihalobacter sp.]|jgi:hypothetical protein|uniref:hypothetical protein n=1 Tax=Acidihalobacter sp. TaxID=1872108 RepID=UPI00307CE164
MALQLPSTELSAAHLRGAFFAAARAFSTDVALRAEIRLIWVQNLRLESRFHGDYAQGGPAFNKSQLPCPGADVVRC